MTTERRLRDAVSGGGGGGRVIESRLVSQSATKQSGEYQGKHTRHLETHLVARCCLSLSLTRAANTCRRLCDDCGGGRGREGEELRLKPSVHEGVSAKRSDKNVRSDVELLCFPVS